MGERLGGFIYGTIVVLAVIVAGAKAFPDESGHIAVLVIVTTLVLWLAHVYAHGIAFSVGHQVHLSREELTLIVRRESSIVEAGVPSVVALLLGALGVIPTHVAIWASLGLGLTVLGAQGLVFARIERLGWLGTVAIVTANLMLGLLLIVLKLLLTH
jgi:hypothetical protein